MGLTLSYIYLDMRPIPSYILFIEVGVEDLNKAFTWTCGETNPGFQWKISWKRPGELETGSGNGTNRIMPNTKGSKAETHGKDRSRLPLSYRFHGISFGYSEPGTDKNLSGMNLSEIGTNERWSIRNTARLANRHIEIGIIPGERR